MKRALLLSALLCMAATNAFAVGCDLTVFACPGNAGAARRTESMVRIATTSYRSFNLAVNINAKVFAIGLMIDGSTSFEASGSPAHGCTMPNGISLEQIAPGSAYNNTVTTLTSGSQMLNVVYVNGSGGVVTPTQRHSWGALKAMYR